MLTLTWVVITLVSLVNSDCTQRFGRCYRYFNITMTWFEAIDFCRSPASGLQNGVPVIQRNLAEANFIDIELLNGRLDTYWLGIFTEQSKNSWMAVTNESLYWSQWHPGQIENSDGEPCGASGMSSEKRGWLDESCDGKYTVICESRQILCDCPSGSLQWYEYDTKQRFLKEMTKQCCCSKPNDVYYSKMSGNSKPFTLINTDRSRSNVECALFCARNIRCIFFRYVLRDHQCLLYESMSISESNYLLQDYGDSFKCISTNN